MKEKIKKIIKFIVIMILSIITIIITIKVVNKESFLVDKKIYNICLNFRNDILNKFFIVITNLGSEIFVILFLIISLFFIKETKYKKVIIINLLNIVLLNIVLKNIFMRKRPNINRLINEFGYSFPSGHAMVSMAFYGMYIYLINVLIKDKKILKNCLKIIISIIILLISFSRVYLGVHYLTDVIVGMIISLLYLDIIINLMNKKINNKKQKEKGKINGEEQKEN